MPLPISTPSTSSSADGEATRNQASAKLWLVTYPFRVFAQMGSTRPLRPEAKYRRRLPAPRHHVATADRGRQLAARQPPRIAWLRVMRGHRYADGAATTAVP